jgi:hypothetical protein
MLPNLESLERFLHQYVTQNQFDNEKQTQLYNKTLKLHPYLNPKYKKNSNPSRFIILNIRNQHSPIDFPHHIFSDIFEISTFSKEQNHTFDLLASTNERFHIFQGPLEVRKHFLKNI